MLSGSTPIGPADQRPGLQGRRQHDLHAALQGSRAASYTIKAVYDGGPDFQTSTDTSHTLTVNPAATTTSAANVTTTFSSSAHSVTLTATVTSTAGTVGEGSETFTVLNGTKVIGTASTGNVAGGKVSVSYNIPANTPVGTYTIKAVYNGTADFLTAMDTAHVLTIKSSAAIEATRLDPTVGSGAAPVSQASQSAPLGAIVNVAATRSSSRRAHRSSVAINRGPLFIGRSAAETRARDSRRPEGRGPPIRGRRPPEPSRLIAVQQLAVLDAGAAHRIAGHADEEGSGRVPDRLLVEVDPALQVIVGRGGKAVFDRPSQRGRFSGVANPISIILGVA